MNTNSMKTMLLLLLMALTSVAMAGEREAHDWKPYEGNGWKASIPSSLYGQAYSEKEREEHWGWWHNTLFESKDGSVSLKVYTHILMIPPEEFQSLRAFFQYTVSGRTEEKAVINYTFIKDNWFVVSGTNSQGFEFYTKFWRYEDHLVEFTFVYPSLKQKVYQPILLKFLRNFVPNLPGEWDY
jgi:hypothetical protein